MTVPIFITPRILISSFHLRLSLFVSKSCFLFRKKSGIDRREMAQGLLLF